MARTISAGYDIMAKNFISVIGKRMKLIGLKEIFEASEIYGPTQIEDNTKIVVLEFAVKILEKYL